MPPLSPKRRAGMSGRSRLSIRAIRATFSRPETFPGSRITKKSQEIDRRMLRDAERTE